MVGNPSQRAAEQPFESLGAVNLSEGVEQARVHHLGSAGSAGSGSDRVALDLVPALHTQKSSGVSAENRFQLGDAREDGLRVALIICSRVIPTPAYHNMHTHLSLATSSGLVTNDATLPATAEL